MSIPDVGTVMLGLSKKRPVFHSEADFQHALAWHLHREHHQCDIRLEYRVPGVREAVNLDVWVRFGDRRLAIELKYKTRAAICIHEGEKFELKDHAAQDLGSYDFIKDICRLEKIQKAHGRVEGWSVLLTNDKRYWTPSQRKTIARQFRLHDRRELRGYMRWDKHAGEGSTRGREKGLLLANSYPLTWKTFSTIDVDGPSEFKFLAVRV